MFCYTFMNWDPVASFKLKESALSAAKLIGRIIETRIKETQMSMGLFGGIFHGPQSLVSPGPEATALCECRCARPRNTLQCLLHGL